MEEGFFLKKGIFLHRCHSWPHSIRSILSLSNHSCFSFKSRSLPGRLSRLLMESFPLFSFLIDSVLHDLRVFLVFRARCRKRRLRIFHGSVVHSSCQPWIYFRPFTRVFLLVFLLVRWLRRWCHWALFLSGRCLLILAIIGNRTTMPCFVPFVLLGHLSVVFSLVGSMSSFDRL